MENLRGAKLSVGNLRGMKNSHNFPKNTPTGYPDLKKTGPQVKYNIVNKIQISEYLNMK